MTLSARIGLTLGVVVLLGAAVGGFVYGRVFEHFFGHVERSDALDTAAVIRRAIQEELDDLARDSGRVALSDRLAEAILTRSQTADLGELLDARVLGATGLDLVFVTDAGGTVYRSHVRHPDRPQGTRLRAFPRDSINLQQLVGRSLDQPGMARSAEPLVTGLIVTEFGPLLLAARNLLPASGQGDRRGIVLVGRFLGEQLDAGLEQSLGFPVDVWPVGSGEIPREIEDLQHEVTSSPSPVLRFVDDKTLEVLLTLDDVQRRPEFLMRATLRRDLAAAGVVAGRSGVLMAVTLSLTLLVVLMASLRVLILRPLETLTKAVVRTGEDEDYGVRIGGEREDEIGMLGREFDRMLERLEEARSQLIGTARSAGMSEIAQEILHSAGTVLNSVNTSAGMLRERVQGLQVADLTQVAAALEAHRHDLARYVTEDPQGVHLQPFLAALAGGIADDHADITCELESLVAGLDRVCELVTSQEDNAGESRVLERVSASRLVEDVASVASAAAESIGAGFVCYVDEDLPMLVTDRRLVVEMLLRITDNACESIERFGPRIGGHRVSLRVSLQLGGRIRFLVQDSGEGIDGIQTDRLFEFGFTTGDGKSGVGLHHAANTAIQLGGSIAIESRGHGEGASVGLTLPLDASVDAGPSRRVA